MSEGEPVGQAVGGACLGKKHGRADWKRGGSSWGVRGGCWGLE